MVVRTTRHRLLVFASLFLWACGSSNPPPAPPDKPATFPIINSFETSQPSVRPGEVVTVSWSVSDADEVRIEPGLVPSSAMLTGQVQTPPLQATVTYKLTAISEAGETERRVTVTVVTGKADILRFEADPALIEPGQSTTLHWETSGASAIKIDALGSGTVYEGSLATGTVDVQPTTSTTYRITIEGDDSGPKTQEANVLVGAQPQVVSFSADAAQITEGQSTTLRWQVENADSVEIRDQADTMIVSNGAATGNVPVSPTVETTYTLIATSAVGTTQQSTTVTVLPPGSPRIVRFEITPLNQVGAGQVTVNWETADADTVDLQADMVSVDTFPRTASGTLMLQVAATTTFTLVAENDRERSTQDVTVTVGAPDTTPPDIMHSPMPGIRTEGTVEEITATIVDSESAVNSASLFYRTTGQPSFQSVVLMDEGNDRYRASIPAGAVVPPGVEYYLQATDGAPMSNSGTSPTGAPANVHSFVVQPDDQAAPSIMTSAVPQDQTEGSAVMVSASVTDASGVATVTLYYKRRSATLYTAISMMGTTGTYSAVIPAQDVLPPGVDYYVEAEDIIMPANLARDPATAPVDVLSFNVVALDRTAPAVSHTPISNGQAEGMPVTVAAEVTDASGVGAVTLFYKPRNAGTYSSVAMSGTGAQRTAQIPLSAVMQPAVDYYIEAVDQATPTSNTAVVPSTAPATPFAFTVSAVDNAAPTISHTAIADGPVPGTALTVTADVVDGSGVALVNLHYRTQGAMNFSQLTMTAAGATYSAQIPGAAVAAPGLDYYFEAVDSAAMANTAVLPMGAPATTFSFATGLGEVEPNGDINSATPFLDGMTTQAIAMGAISPSNDQDFWIIDVPAGPTRYTVRVEVTVGGVGVCNQADPEIFLLAADGTTVLVTDDLDGVGSCPIVDPTVDRGARALAAGRYYIRVEEDGRNQTIAQYELRGQMTPVTCGNGIVESAGGELCDDNNTVAGDGCSATCQFEPVATFMAPGGTFTESISPGGDQDLYAIVIAQGQFLTAFTSASGGSGCPGDTVIELYDTDGVTRLGTDDDGGASNCSNINPVSDAWTASMAAGTYWMRVRGYSSGTVIGSYDINVQIAGNICGNNQVETGEQCDDGDISSGDGCSSTCQWETAGMASGTGGSFTGAISPAGNIDWYQVTVQADESIRAETFVAADGACTSDTVIRLWQADRTTELGSDDDDGLNRCSLLDPADDLSVRQLAAGTYFVTVEEYGNNSSIAAYTLNISIQAPTCGDGWVAGTEQCDDGNALGGDGCSAACAWEGSGEVEPNDLRTSANVLIPSGNTSGSAAGVINQSGDYDWYEIVVPTGAHVLAEVVGFDGGCPTDSEVSLRSVTGTELAFDTRDGPGECGRISPGGNVTARDLMGGTYYVRVGGTASSATYQVRVQIFTPGCGDLYLATGEQCDDGNTASGDGCSATCQYELAEMEPNNTSSAAMNLSAVTQTVNGDITTAGDEDWYSVTVPQGTRLAVFTHDGAIDQCPNVNSNLAVFDDTGTMVLANDDGDGPQFCSAIYADEAGVLAAGTYRIRVRGYNTTVTFPYGLWLEVR